MSSSDRVDLRVQVGALRLANPVIAANGTSGSGLESAHLMDMKRQGGFAAEAISVKPIEGARVSRPCEASSGTLNAVGLQNLALTSLVEEEPPLLQGHNDNAIVDVFEVSLDDCAEAIQGLEDAPGIATRLLDFTSPSAKSGGTQSGNSPDPVAEVALVSPKATGRRLL